MRIIEEVLQDIGELDFGHGVTAKTDLGIWRTRGEHRPLSWRVRVPDPIQGPQGVGPGGDEKG
jgi:hypothetical protein